MSPECIKKAISNRETYAAQLSILIELSGETNQELKQKLRLIDHWLTFVNQEEAFILRRHLIERKSWNEIEDELAQTIGIDKTPHQRTLQRIQARAIKRVEEMMSQAFGATLDHLFQDCV